MSRIGYKEIDLPSGVEISQDGNVVTVKGHHDQTLQRYHQNDY